MKKITNQIMFPLFLNYFFFTYLAFQKFFITIKSDSCDNCKFEPSNPLQGCISKSSEPSNTNECQNCKPHLGITDKCFDCSGVTSFYIIYDNGTCIPKNDGCENKIVNETNECVGHCFDATYEIGDYCTFNCNDTYNKIKNDILKTCECKYKYLIYKENELNKKKRIECLSSEDFCEFFDYDTHECLQNCGNKKIRDMGDSNSDGYKYRYRCSNECLKGEFYSSTTDENSKEVEYCTENACKNENQYFYNNSNGINYCVEYCNNEDFYSEKECTKKCKDEDAKVKIEDTKKLICVSEEPGEDFYKYEEIYYLANCSYTQQLKLFNYRTTYNYENKTGQNLCVDTCSEKDQFNLEGTIDCIDCKGKFSDGSNCYNSCDSIGQEYFYINDNPNGEIDETVPHDPYKCTKKCPDGYYVDKKNKVCYKDECPRSLYSSNNFECFEECKNITDPSSIKEGEGFIIIEKNSDEIINKKLCYSSCSISEYKYHNLNNNICFQESCKELHLYSSNDNPYICYSSCKEIGENYKYEKDYTCYETELICDNYYYMDNGIKQCASKVDCMNHQKKYLRDKECRDTCEPGDYIIKSISNNVGELQDLGACVEDVKYCINEGYIFYNNTDKICSKTCNFYKTSEENPMKNKNNETCFTTCPESYPYKDNEKMLCRMNCDENQYNDGTYCLTSCQDSSTNKKYAIYGTKECIENTCIKDDNTYYKVKDDDQEVFFCYHSCPDEYKFLEKENIENGRYVCKKKCSDYNPYYYEDEKICRNDCNILYNSTNETCVYRCEYGQKVVNKSFCIDTCPIEEPYIIIEKLSDDNSLIVEKCVSNCTESFPYKSKSTNYCLKECTNLSELYSYNYTCYEKCPDGTYADELEKKCYDNGCPEGFKYFEEEGGFYKCKKSCTVGKFYLPEGGECMAACPPGYNYLARDYICLMNCTSTYGEYFEKNENMYKCQSSCGTKKVNPLTKECFSEKCTDDYYEAPNGKCYNICKYDNEYPFSDINGSKKVCAAKCGDDNPNYEKDEKNCKSGCSGDNNISDYDGSCVSSCSHSYYKYLEDGKCVNKCGDTKFNNNGICVAYCEAPFNYIEGNECKKKCDDDHFSQKKTEGEKTIYNCVEKCDSKEYYYESPNYLKKQCLPSCIEDDFIIQDTHICTKQCTSPYKLYYPDQGQSGTSERKYESNTCVLKCPPDKPYLYRDSICVSTCSGDKYHIDGQFDCLSICPPDTSLNDDFTCKSSCPENKFLDHTGKNCIDSCKNDGEYNYYTEGVNKCLKMCEDNYYIGDENEYGYKCVKTCNNIYLDLVYKKCTEKCPAERSFVNQYDNNKCVDKCPNKIYENKDNIKKCLINCDYIYPDGECKEKCNEPYIYYNYENSSCLEGCPNYFAPSTDNNAQYRCYNKCPSQYPYYNGASCTNNCNYYINLTSYECHKECDTSKYFVYEDSDKKYCLDKCSDVGAFLLGENKCVKDCYNNYIPNLEKKTCECKEYYYINEDKAVICFSKDDLNICEASPDYKICLYKYRLYDTNQYLKECSDENHNIISVDQKYCYPPDFKYPNEIMKLEGNQLKCLYKFYKNTETSSIECLTKDESCPSDYKYLIPENQECTNSCDENNIFGNYCLNSDCIGKKFWFVDETHYECNDNCPQNYYEIENLKQCVKNCTETDYYIIHNGKCILSCEDSTTILKKSTKKLANNLIETFFECACTSDLWYKDNDNKIICNSDTTKTKCKDLINTNPLLIKETGECVSQCPDDYKFKFNNECFSNCEDVSNYYSYNAKIKNENDNEKTCRCENLWIKDENDENIEKCIKGNTCEEPNSLLVIKTGQCINECPQPYNIEFNKTCYDECPSNTEEKEIEDSKKTCSCINKWYINNKGFTVCLNDNDICPKDFYPYLVKETNECVQSSVKCTAKGKKIFNNICSDECPINTISKEDDINLCTCDGTKGKWHQYTDDNGILKFECGLTDCPSSEKNYTNNENQECLYSCGDLYNFNKVCYKKCPENTQLVNEISKLCEEFINFDNPENIEDLKEKVSQTIKDIYPKASKGGIVYNINNSTLQIYGVNKNKKEDPNLIMRTNLTYIDLSNCIDKIYKKIDISSETDLIIEKYDIGDLTNSSTINPVEYKVRNSETGQEINIKEICDDNSIIISYPIGNILNSFVNENNNLRNLDEESKNNLNLREKFLKGKDLFLENEEIDSFNYENKLYTDICYSLDINGKDLILEDRFNYLYPLYSFCESNCLYGKTDFVLERVFCNCSPKSEVNLQRPVELLDVDADINKVKDNQKGSILKCIGKISEIVKNFGFFYGLIIILVEIAMALLTFLYSYKILNMRLKNKFDINGDGNNNIDTENAETINLSKAKNNRKNTNENIIKSSERNLDNPPKRKKKRKTDRIEDKKEDRKKLETKNKDEEDPEELNIPKTTNLEKGEKISSTNSYNLYFEKSSSGTVNESDDDSIFDIIKSEIKLLRVDYDNALKKNKAEILVIIFSEILDKIYIIKAIWFLQKYEIFSLYFSLYLLWHMLIVSFLSLFFNNSTLHNIWIEDNYPTLNFHLGYGFISCILSFIIYKGLSFLINNDKKIAEIDSIEKENKTEINSKFEKMMFWAKIKMIIFYAVTFILILIFYLYLIAFCGIYTQTQGLLIESYGISIIEVIIIKILYGFVLGILRKISLSKKIDKLYLIVRILDLYVS